MKYIINTLGCKVNQYETQAIETMLRERGHTPACDGESADVVIVNSCAVTAESGRKSRQALRRLMERNPGALSVICGCWPQIDEKSARELGADIVRGSGDRRELVDAIEAAASSVKTDKPFLRREFERLPAGAYEGHARAYLKIEDGCENFCSYCVIPYARGRVRSLPPDEAAAEAGRLYDLGYRELVLTGIEIASYGADLSGKPDLGDAVAAICAAAPGLRVRLGSLEPSIMAEELCERLAELRTVCPHFHLSLQSGCDRTLRRMNRKYGTAEFYAVCERLRRFFPDCALTADLITGFPGETEEDHEETLRFIRKCAFSSMHVFPYSRRPGTPADRLPEQLTAAVKSERAAEASRVAEEMKREYLEKCVGKTLDVLIETVGEDFSLGHAGNYTEVAVAGAQTRGEITGVLITGTDGDRLTGRAI